MSRTLNKWNREEIMRRALDHRFGPAKIEREKRWRSLGDNIWAHAYGEQAKKLSAEAGLAPWLHMSSTIRVAFGSSWETVSLSCRLPVKAQHANNNTPVARCEPGEPLFEAWAELKREEKEHDAEVQKARAMLKAILMSVKTVRQLEKVWPEGKPFYERLLDVPTPAQLPVDPAALNKALGLPLEA